MEGRADAPRAQGPRMSSWRRMFRPLLPRAMAPVRMEEPPPAASPDPAAFDGPPVGARKEETPVQFEMFAAEWQQMSQQDNFDGFRLEAANQVTKHLQAAHTLFLGTQLRECGYIYQFGPAFQSEDGKTMLVARAGLDGAVNGRVIQKLGSGWEIKGSSNSHLKDAQRNVHEGSIEYAGSDWTGAAKTMWQGAWLFSGAYTQRVLPFLQLGGDLTFVAANGITIGQIGARWAKGKDTFYAQLARTPDMKNPFGQNHEAKFCYMRKVTDRLSLGSEFKFSLPDQESGMSLAYEYVFRQARVQGLLDTDGKVSCCVSDFTGFGFSGAIDYFRGDYKFGVVMHVLPQPEGQPPM